MAGWVAPSGSSPHDGWGNHSGGGGPRCQAGYGGGVGESGSVGESRVSARGGEQCGPCEGGDGGESARVADREGEAKIWNMADDLFCGVRWTADAAGVGGVPAVGGRGSIQDFVNFRRGEKFARALGGLGIDLAMEAKFQTRRGLHLA